MQDAGAGDPVADGGRHGALGQEGDDGAQFQLAQFLEVRGLGVTGAVDAGADDLEVGGQAGPVGGGGFGGLVVGVEGAVA